MISIVSTSWFCALAETISQLRNIRYKFQGLQREKRDSLTNTFFLKKIKFDLSGKDQTDIFQKNEAKPENNQLVVEDNADSGGMIPVKFSLRSGLCVIWLLFFLSCQPSKRSKGESAFTLLDGGDLWHYRHLNRGVIFLKKMLSKIILNKVSSCYCFKQFDTLNHFILQTSIFSE